MKATCWCAATTASDMTRPARAWACPRSRTCHTGWACAHTRSAKSRRSSGSGSATRADRACTRRLSCPGCPATGGPPQVRRCAWRPTTCSCTSTTSISRTSRRCTRRRRRPGSSSCRRSITCPSPRRRSPTPGLCHPRNWLTGKPRRPACRGIGSTSAAITARSSHRRYSQKDGRSMAATDSSTSRRASTR